MAAGNFFSLFLIEDTVYYAGENQYTLKKIMNNATRIEASSFGAALTQNNELYIFG